MLLRVADGPKQSLVVATAAVAAAADNVAGNSAAVAAAKLLGDFAGAAPLLAYLMPSCPWLLPAAAAAVGC